MIRRATAADKNGVLELIADFYSEYLIDYGFRFDYDLYKQDFDICAKHSQIVALLIENEGQIDGFIAGVIVRRPFFPDVAANELMWYVRKSARKDGVKLLNAFERRCQEMGCSEILMVGLSDTKAENMLGRFGYTRLESTFIKRIKNEV